MQHLDESRLAEYVDARARGTTVGWEDVSTHIVTCATCRATVDQLEAERTRAEAILAGSGPREIALPPFEAVRARARRRRPGGGALRVLALAATAVVVVGVSWLGRDIWLGTEPAPVSDAVVPPAAVSDQDALGAVAEPRAREVAAEPGSVAEAEGRPARGLAQQAAPLEDRAKVDEPAAPTPVVADRIAARRVADTLQVMAERRALEAAPAEEAPAAAPTPAPSVVSAAGAGARARDEMERQGTADADEWQIVDRDEAERVLGGPVQVVEGLPVLDHAFARGTEASPRVRTRQLLAPERYLELLQTRRETGLRLRSQGRTDLAVVQVDRGVFTIQARAPLSRDSLAVLLRRLRPEAP